MQAICAVRKVIFRFNPVSALYCRRAGNWPRCSCNSGTRMPAVNFAQAVFDSIRPERCTRRCVYYHFPHMGRHNLCAHAQCAGCTATHAEIITTTVTPTRQLRQRWATAYDCTAATQMMTSFASKAFVIFPMQQAADRGYSEIDTCAVAAVPCIIAARRALLRT